MKVLLVYPAVSSSERYGSLLGLFGGRQIPLGLYCLAAYLRQHDVPTDAVDAEALQLPPAEIIRRLKDGGFGLLGISSTTVTFHRAADLARQVKQALPDTVIVVGGPHVSSQPAHPLAACPSFDYAIRHEGEETLLELLRTLRDGGRPEDVKGLIFRRNGDIVVNEPRPYIQDIDSLPFPAYDLIPDMSIYSPPPFNSRRQPVANIITSRGCPNECTFCENTTFGRRLRLRSAESVVAEIELLVRHGAREIAFVDDTFTIRGDRLRAIFELTRARGLDFTWSCMSRINTVDEDLLRFMKAHGCWYVAFGVESGNQDVLRVIRKNIRLEDVERVVTACRRLGLTTKGFFMVGHPTETVETLEATIAFACRIPLDHVVVTINTPMPGTDQYRHAREYGTLDESNWRQFNYWSPVFVPTGLTPEILRRKQREFLRRFYLRPRVLWAHFKAIATTTAGLYSLRNIAKTLWQYVARRR